MKLTTLTLAVAALLAVPAFAQVTPSMIQAEKQKMLDEAKNGDNANTQTLQDRRRELEKKKAERKMMVIDNQSRGRR